MEFDEVIEWCTTDGYLVKRYIKYLPNNKVVYQEIKEDLSVTPRYATPYGDFWTDSNKIVHFIKKHGFLEDLIKPLSNGIQIGDMKIFSCDGKTFFEIKEKDTKKGDIKL